MNIHTICLYCTLAFAATANAQVPPEADEPQWPEDATWPDVSADDVAMFDADGIEFEDAPVVQDQPHVAVAGTAGEEPSVKRELKRSLLGAVMPKVQRRLREAIGDER